MPKYHVYISATLDDLAQEKRELAKIVTELGHIPITMDYFDAGDRYGQGLIKKSIEESDYFLILTAHKYGDKAAVSEGEGKPIPEREYAHAIHRGKPVLALIIDEKARWKDSKKEKDKLAVQALEKFKDKLRTHPCETWLNSTDLKQKAQKLLIREFNLNPQDGWVPSSRMVKAEVANELARLSEENEALRHQVKLDGSGMVTRIREQMKHALKVLAVNRIDLSFYYTPGGNWENTQKFHYLQLFRLLTPELSLKKTVGELSRFLGNILNPDLEKTVRRDFPTPSNTIKKIMADFALLRLVRCSGIGDDEAWEITEYGKEVYAAYRMRQMERGLIKKE